MVKGTQILLTLAFAVGFGGAGCTFPRRDNSGDPPILLRPFSSFVRYHVKQGTHIDGPRCPMYPSCAAYADNAIHRAGFIGFLLFIDRLFFREWGRLDHRYRIAPVSVSHETRYFDPLDDSLPFWEEPHASLVGERFSGE